MQNAKAELNDIGLKREAYEKARVELRKAEDKLRQEKALPRARGLVGSIWKFRNAYSCPEGEADRWWLYKRVVGVTDDANLICQASQIDQYGHLSIKLNDWQMLEHFPGNTHVAATAEEWEAHLALVADILRKMSL